MTGTLLPDGTRLQPGEEIFKMEIKFPPDASGGRGGAFALEDGNLLAATGLAIGPLTSTRPASHTPIPVQNGQPFHPSSPRADILNDAGQGTHASLTSIQNAARVGDYGWLSDLVRSGALVPDCKIRGIGAFKVGPSAEKATTTAAGLWAKHQATLQDNRKITTGHRL